MTAGGCESDHCVTCADEAVPMVVLVAGADGLADCAGEDGAETTVMTDLVGAVAAGDRVLVHAGVALARVDVEPVA